LSLMRGVSTVEQDAGFEAQERDLKAVGVERERQPALLTPKRRVSCDSRRGRAGRSRAPSSPKVEGSGTAVPISSVKFWFALEPHVHL
jgi:hypothetical protein